VLRDLFEGKEVSLQTPVFSMQGVKLDFLPAQQVPLYVATSDPDGYRLVGELADGLILGDLGDPDAIRWAIGLMTEGARSAGRNPADIAVVGWITTIVTDDAAGVKDKLRAVMAMAARGMHKATRQSLAIDDATIVKIRAAIDNGMPVDNDVLPDETIDRLAIVGSAAQCLQRMRMLRDAGVTQISARMPAAVAATMNFDGNLSALATEILPRLR
jgi:5,10-methylenetetrahydromethanopterin reductase